MAFLGDDGYDYPHDRPRRRSPRGYYDEYRRSGYLDPRPGNGGGLQRTRSTGAQPAPNIYIYNDQVQDTQQRAGSPYQPPPQAPMPYPASPEFRGRTRLGDELVEDLADLALRDGRRSRSRGRSDVGGDRQGFYEYELQRKERELEEERRRELAEKEWELRRMREDDKRRRASEERDSERKRIEKEYELKKMRDDDKRRRASEDEDAERKRIIAEFEDKKRRETAAAKYAEIRLLEKMEREKKDRREEEERMKEKIKKDEEAAKEKRKREYEAFLAEQKAKQEKEKADKKAEKDKFEREMRRRLEEFGVYSQQQIDYMVDEEKAKKAQAERSRSRGREPDALEIWQGNARPVYPKVHRDYLSVETLIYYNIPYEYDRADPSYLIIRREMDKYETDLLFEHTRRIRAGTLLIEEPPKKKNYAWYRKRERSSSRVRKVGILEVKRVV